MTQMDRSGPSTVMDGTDRPTLFKIVLVFSFPCGFGLGDSEVFTERNRNSEYQSGSQMDELHRMIQTELFHQRIWWIVIGDRLVFEALRYRSEPNENLNKTEAVDHKLAAATARRNSAPTAYWIIEFTHENRVSRDAIFWKWHLSNAPTTLKRKSSEQGFVRKSLGQLAVEETLNLKASQSLTNLVTQLWNRNFVIESFWKISMAFKRHLASVSLLISPALTYRTICIAERFVMSGAWWASPLIVVTLSYRWSLNDSEGKVVTFESLNGSLREFARIHLKHELRPMNFLRSTVWHLTDSTDLADLISAGNFSR